MTYTHDVDFTLNALLWARRVANFAESCGYQVGSSPPRPVSAHLGAVLADSILQAGVNYRTVVRPRVERIIQLFPEAATLTGTTAVVSNGLVADFLLWQHSEKIGRFLRLHQSFAWHGIEDTGVLRAWLQLKCNRDLLLQISGIGPKTVDYLCCLVGVDCIAVDRHVRAFATRAGVDAKEYDTLRLTFSFAADLLGASRRDFDSWIWDFVTVHSPPHGLR